MNISPSNSAARVYATTRPSSPEKSAAKAEGEGSIASDSVKLSVPTNDSTGTVAPAEKEETKRVLRDLKVGGAVGAVLGAVGGALAGAAGLAIAAFAAPGVGIISAVVGAAAGGYLAGKLAFSKLAGADIPGVLGIIGASALGAAAGGVAGFALGTVGAGALLAGGGAALVGGVGGAALGATVGGLGTVVGDALLNRDKFPNYWSRVGQELVRP